MQYWAALVGLFALFVPSLCAAQYYSYCPEPIAPYVVDGYYAESYEMDAARADVERFIADVEEYQDCLARNAAEASDVAQRVIDEWNEAVSVYNSRY